MHMLTDMFITCGAHAHLKQLHGGDAVRHPRGAGHDRAPTLQKTFVAAFCYFASSVVLLVIMKSACAPFQE